MSDIKCPMCTDCPDNCPLDTEEDTREYSADYYKGKADGVREFAEWLLHHSMLCDSFGQSLNDYDLLSESEIIDEVLAEWQKEQSK